MIIKNNLLDNINFKSSIPVGLVFGMHVQGLGIAHSLSREGIPVFAIDHDESNFGLYSKYVTGFIVPDATKNEALFIDFLINIGKKLKNKGVLFPTQDIELIILSKHKEILGEYFLYPMSEYNTIIMCVDKFKLYPIAEKLGIPFPKTFYPKSIDEVEKISREIEYPYIIKPNRHENFFKVFKKTALHVTNRKELLDRYKEAVEKGLEVTVQEEILGRADRLYTLGSYADRNSNLLAVFTGRKIRQFPPDFGDARFAEAVYEPEIIKLGKLLIKGLNYHGISQVEFKKDPKDNKFKLMEINARSWRWISLSTACGVNIPLIAYKDTIGEKINKQIQNYHCNKKWIFLLSDFMNCCGGLYKKMGFPHERLSLLQCLQSIKGKKTEAVFSCKDPKPFIKLLFEKTMSLINKLK